MKRIMVLFGLVVLLQNCKKAEPDAVSVTPTVPDILSFTVPGIPPENVVIDKANREVQLTVPTSLSVSSFTATIGVTSGYISSYNSGRYEFNILYGTGPLYFYKEGDYSGSPVGTPYKIVKRAGGPLEITSGPASLTLETGNALLVLTKNYYDDATSDNKAIVTNQLTGQQVEGPLYIQNNTVDGSVYAQFPSSIPPGAYTLEIRKSNNRQARASSPLRVVRGLPTAYDDTYNPPAPGTRNRPLRGINLIEDDRVELFLKNLAGDQYKLTPTSFATDGGTAYVDIPATIKPSQYSIQFIRNGQLVPSYSRIVISKDRSQPAFISLYNKPTNAAPEVPVVFERQKKQFFTFVIAANVARVRLKLTPVGSNQPVILLAVDAPSSYFQAGPDGGIPSFVLPQTTPVGKYVLSLQYVMYTGETLEGEPFERLAEVQ